MTIPLLDGSNLIEVLVSDPVGNAARTSVAVVRDSSPPTLSVTSPVNGAQSDVPTIAVSGSTEPEARVTANGIMVAVAADGSFTVAISLAEDANTILVTATDMAGNAASTSVSVTYVSPISGLQQNLSVTRKALDAMNASSTVLAMELILVFVLVVGVVAALQVMAFRRIRRKAERKSPPEV